MFGKRNNSNTGSLILFAEQLGGPKNFSSWFRSLLKQELLSTDTKQKYLDFNEIKDLSRSGLLGIAEYYLKNFPCDLCVITVDNENRRVEFTLIKFKDSPDPFAAMLKK